MATISSWLKKFINRNTSGYITIVSGLPRSGTSMMMKMLEAGGIPPLTDGLRRADDNNPRGYFEFERVKKLPDGDTGWLAEAQGKAVKVISALLEYLPARYPYRIVFMERDLSEVLSSQRRMLVRDGKEDSVQDAELADLYTRHLQQVQQMLRRRAEIPVLYLSYNAVLENSGVGLERLNSFLGGSLDLAGMQRVVDVSLYRERSKPKEQE